MAEYQYPTPNVKALTFSEAIYNLMEAGHLLRQHVNQEIGAIPVL